MKVRQFFLLITAIGLIPIALSYGLVPQKSLKYLFDISVADINGIHIYRAVMGLYIGLIIFWIMGSIKRELTQAALYSLIVFMFGLAGGRILSLILDGMPHWLLSVYLLLEIGFGFIGVYLLKKAD